MWIVDRRLLGAVSLCALLAALPACVHRPLGVEDDGGAIDVGGPGQGGQTGTGCGSGAPGLELVGTTLTVLDQPPTSGNLYTSLVWTGQEYLFIWRIFGGADVLMQRIDVNGQGVGGNIRVRDFESALDVAWGSGRLAAVWSREDAGVGRPLMFQTFDSLGRPLIEETTLRSSAGIAFDGSVSYGPRIAATKDGFALVWGESSQVFVATADVEGHLLKGPIVATGGELRSSPVLSLAAGDDRFAIGWNGEPRISQPGPMPGGLTVARVFSSGLTPLGGANTLDTEAFNRLPQVLAAGSGFLALWTHGVPIDLSVPLSDAEVRITQLDGTGASTANGLMDPPARGPYPELVPAVWNGDHLAVLWGGKTAADTGLTLSRFTPTGTRQGPSIALQTAAPAGRFYITAHDGTLAFIWSEEIAGGYEVYFQQARSCP